MKANEMPWVGSEDKHADMTLRQLVRGLTTKVLEPCRLPFNRIIGNDRFVGCAS